MSALFNRTVIQYGTFRFPVETETTNLIIRPEWDGAERTAVANTYEITLYTTLANINDNQVRAIVQQLSKPAFPFLYQGTGLGVQVNIGNRTDLAWGPKPQVISVKPLGGGNAVGLTWTVKLSIPDFAGHENYRGQLMEFNFGLTYDVDASGFTNRVYSGYCRIPMTRAGSPLNRKVIDSVDRFREDINPPLMLNFRRASRTFTISPDKRTLEFRIVDEELRPNVPPPDVLHAEASHSMNSTPGKLYEWTATLSATYEVVPGRVTSAIRAFFALLRDRVGWSMHALKLAGGPTSPPPPPGVAPGNQIQNIPNKPSIIPITFTLNEPEIYGNTKVSLACTYRINGASLKDMLTASGLWRPTPDSNYKLWAASVAIPQSPRGYAQLVFAPGSDSIVDLGQSVVEVDLRNGGGRGPLPVNTLPPGIFPPPRPETSWLSWKNSIYLESNNGLVKVNLLDDKNKNAKPEDLMFGNGFAAAGGAVAGLILPKTPGFFYEPPPKAAEHETNFQLRSEWAWITMFGSATRAGYPIECPTLLKWGDQKLYPANRTNKGEGFWCGVVGNCGVPVHGARWKLRFFCPKIPDKGDLPVPKDPFDNS